MVAREYYVTTLEQRIVCLLRLRALMCWEEGEYLVGDNIGTMLGKEKQKQSSEGKILRSIQVQTDYCKYSALSTFIHL